MDVIYDKGNKIAQALGNGIVYLGPQRSHDGAVFTHMFCDGENGGFSANSLDEARQKFTRLRITFKKPSPIFT